MTDTEILTKAIEKAVKNGWKKPVDYEFDWFIKNGGYGESFVRGLLFSHEFAKVFFGEEEVCGLENCYLRQNKDCDHQGILEVMSINGPTRRMNTQPCWEFHIQKMVLSENPIKYLEKFL